jgi:hypothetical protein
MPSSTSWNTQATPAQIAKARERPVEVTVEPARLAQVQRVRQQPFEQQSQQQRDELHGR